MAAGQNLYARYQQSQQQAAPVYGALGRTAADTEKALQKENEARKQNKSILDQTVPVLQKLGYSVLGFATAGMRGTAELNQLSFAFQRFTREIANAFAPQIHGLINLFHRLADALKGMSAQGQQTLRSAGGFAAGAALGGRVAGPWGALAGGVLGGMSGTPGGQQALERLAASLARLLAALVPVFEGLTRTLAPVVDVLARFLGVLTGAPGAMTAFVEAAWEAAKELGRAVAQSVAPLVTAGVDFERMFEKTGKAAEKTGLTMAGGGTMDPRQLIQRITERALATDYARKTSENTQKSATLLDEIMRILQEAAQAGRGGVPPRVPENA